MKVLIPGGHLTPALAFIDYLQATHPEDQVVFCGRRYSQDSLRQVSQEKAEVDRRQIPFTYVWAPRWDHASLVNKVAYPLMLVFSVLRALKIILTSKPDVVLSFGGYLAVPIAVAANLARVPVVTHEQTRSIGTANRLISKLARKVAITYPETAETLPAAKVVVTGNPLRPGLFLKQPKPSWIGNTSKPIIYVTGGNQGSEIINVTVQQGLRHLLKEWTVIHQCGNPTRRRRYKDELEQASRKLPPHLQANYVVREWLTESELAWIYQHAQVVVSRAGANTVLELAAYHLPSVLIPLPFAHGDEQLLNARYLADAGGAVLVFQKELSVVTLQAALEKATKHHRSMSQKLKQLVVPTDAAAKLYQVLSAVL